MDIAQLPMDVTPCSFCFIRLHDPSDTDLVDQITKDLRAATNGVKWSESYVEAESTKTV